MTSLWLYGSANKFSSLLYSDFNWEQRLWYYGSQPLALLLGVCVFMCVCPARVCLDVSCVCMCVCALVPLWDHNNQ